MFFGLPLRTTNATTEVVDEALVRAGVPVVGDEAGLHQPRHVGLGRERHDVGLQAGLDRAALVAGGAEGRLEADALALGASSGSPG